MVMMMNKVIVRLDEKNVEIFEDAWFIEDPQRVLYVKRGKGSDEKTLAIFKKYMYVVIDEDEEKRL